MNPLVSGRRMKCLAVLIAVFFSAALSAHAASDNLYADDASYCEPSNKCALTDPANAEGAPDNSQAAAAGQFSKHLIQWRFQFSNQSQTGTFNHANITVYNFRQSGWSNDNMTFDYSDDGGTTWYTLEVWNSSNAPPTADTNKTYAVPNIGSWAEVNRTVFRVAGVAQVGGPDTITWRVDAALLNVTYDEIVAADTSFMITLPGSNVMNITSTVPTAPNATAAMNFTMSSTGTAGTQSNVAPCVGATADCQTDSTPFFDFKNIGNVVINITMKLNATLPAAISLVCDKDNDPSGGTAIGAAFFNVSNGLAVGSSISVWCWTSFTDSRKTDATYRGLLHNATQVS